MELFDFDVMIIVISEYIIVVVDFALISDSRNCFKTWLCSATCLTYVSVFLDSDGYSNDASSLIICC